MNGVRPKLDRADRLLGCLVWKPLAALLGVVAFGAAWAALAILRDATGAARWLGTLLAVLAATVFGAAAVLAARKRRISEIDP